MTDPRPWETFRSFATGLARWADFVDACLEGKGLAGVVRRGFSPAEEERRKDSDRWRAVWTSNPMECVNMIGYSRLAIGTSQIAGLASLLETGRPTAAVPTVLRACAETSARAIWVLDQDLSARDAIARAMTEWLHDLGQHDGHSVRKRADEIRRRIVDFATKAGWHVHRDRKSGEPIGIIHRRPTAKDLLDQLARRDTVAPFREVMGYFRRSGNAAAHGFSLGWAEVLSAKGDPLLENLLLKNYSTHVMYALELHLHAVDAWNASVDWAPHDLFQEARKASFAGVVLPYFQMILSEREQVARGQRVG